MTGRQDPYEHIPYFYSDLFDLGYEAVGRLSANMELVEDWEDPFRKGVVYYVLDDRIEGILLWNNWGQIDQARNLIGSTFRTRLAMQL